MRTVELNGERVAVHVEGRGRHPVLLLHGFQDRASGWAGVARRLAEGDWRGIAPDLVGCGSSSRPDDWRRCTIEAYAADVAALIGHLGLPPPAVVGHSLGAGVALRLALDRPELVGSLVLVAPVSTTGLDFVPLEALDALRHPSRDDQLALLRAAFRRPPPTDVLDAVIEAVGLASAAHIEGAARSMEAFDVQDELERLHLPVLVVAGDRDRHVPLANHLATAAAIPRCGLQVFHDVGHVPFLEVPDEFHAVVRHFLVRAAA